MAQKCVAITSRHKQCSRDAVSYDGYCTQHIASRRIQKTARQIGFHVHKGIVRLDCGEYVGRCSICGIELELK